MSTKELTVCYIVSTTCELCDKKGRKCIELAGSLCICDTCLRDFVSILDSIQRRVTSKKDLV